MDLQKNYVPFVCATDTGNGWSRPAVKECVKNLVPDDFLVY